MTEQHEKFCSLIKEYRPGLFRVAKGILKNDMDAEDAVSETTCKAFANLHKLRAFDSFKPWVMKILINEAYGIARKRKKTEPLVDMSDESDHSDMLESLELWDAVKLLGVEFRTVTILFYYEDMSIKEISKILNLPQGTVNSRLKRSREKLKTILTSKEVT
ncbi:sigma-70 family RNA polymerase sigma factor [Sinanaerobacter chloroacetimidivorans]|uniref:Sigma-70 family RNA polymerase sigma factor n=1 Tax=Sinanaerobacter chloroacetimidivorans TaxID=2818044 RepID=A0A8J7W006_9FIRM|nr:sigma-70 family RNA polymerase sigma factor [Sinanaerobacter chloroacetimidivorans]MBR0596671.1 sigma-70 family RNA polymerase sigma factor [Sinanaerobacter chloroacetimidivorans]